MHYKDLDFVRKLGYQQMHFFKFYTDINTSKKLYKYTSKYNKCFLKCKV